MGLFNFVKRKRTETVGAKLLKALREEQMMSIVATFEQRMQVANDLSNVMVKSATDAAKEQQAVKMLAYSYMAIGMMLSLKILRGEVIEEALKIIATEIRTLQREANSNFNHV